ncbi:MAG: hypothetical protein IJY82_07535 [Oscillospiraceae bacterium]|nr:hypothetical protein [Oscillospiraceae bacterium]
MKKAIAAISCIALAASFASCGLNIRTGVKESPGIFESTSSYADIVSALDEEFDFRETASEDGSLIVEMTPAEPEHPATESQPAIPIILPSRKPVKPEISETETPVAPKEPEAPVLPEIAPEREPEVTPEKEPAPTLETTPIQPEEEEESAPVVPEEPDAPTKPEEPEAPQDPVPAEPQPEPTPTPTTPKYTYTTGQTHTPVPFQERYLYSFLDEEMKECYRKIDRAIKELAGRVSFSCNIAEDRKYMIYFLYAFDHPEHFYLGNTMTIYNHGDGTSSILLCYSDGESYCNYGTALPEIDDSLRASIRDKKAIFDRTVSQILSTIPADAPDVVKERLIYDRILMDSFYHLGAKWKGVAPDDWTAYGIVVNHYGVCESYAEAFQALCLAAGINCTGIVGTAGGGHKWNAVQLEGEWYICDITFDDPIGGEEGAAYHYYFNRTTAEMEEMNHDSSNSDWPVPVATATKYSFSEYFGECRW